MEISSQAEAKLAIEAAWPTIVAESRQVLGGELHYQAMVYHALRSVSGVPLTQIGMNVKQRISKPTTDLFRQLDARKHPEYRGGFEPIPDLVIFSTEVQGDWRRRNRTHTLQYMLLALEIKASERNKSRLTPGEIVNDIRKLQAHRAELRARGCEMTPGVMVIDVAPDPRERMTDSGLQQAREFAASSGVGWLYFSSTQEALVWNGD